MNLQTAQNILDAELAHINENYFISKCNIPMTELRSISGLDIDGDLNSHIKNEFYEIIPHEITSDMIQNTLMHIDGDNAMTQYITQHNIDTTKKMRSTPNTYRILVQLSNNNFPMNKTYSKKYEKIIELFHPIMHYLCNKIIGDYCTD